MWHTVYVTRRANHIEVWADDCNRATGKKRSFNYKHT